MIDPILSRLNPTQAGLLDRGKSFIEIRAEFSLS
jgi:hypothetical protein